MSWNRRLINLITLCSLFFLCWISHSIKAQESDYTLKPPRDYSIKPATIAGFIELGGNAGLYSLNIDKIYFYKNNLKLSARLGFSPKLNGTYVEQNYVVEQNIILFKNPHHLELGIGLTLQRRFNETQNEQSKFAWESLWFPIMRCGYRYQKEDGGLFFRAGITPGITSKDALGFHSNYFQLWAGLSIGMGF